MLHQPMDLLPAQRYPQGVRHDQFGGGVPLTRRLVGVLLAAVRQHLPVAVEGGRTTALLPKRAEPLALWDIFWPHTHPSSCRARCGSRSSITESGNSSLPATWGACHRAACRRWGASSDHGPARALSTSDAPLLCFIRTPPADPLTIPFLAPHVTVRAARCVIRDARSADGEKSYCVLL